MRTSVLVRRDCAAEQPIAYAAETLEFEEPIAVLLKEIEALDAAAAHRCARARDRVAAAAARDGARASSIAR